MSQQTTGWWNEAKNPGVSVGLFSPRTTNNDAVCLAPPRQALEEERDGLSHILGRERSHGSGLEQLIEASRLREASVAAEQRQLAKERDRLETKVSVGPVLYRGTYLTYIRIIGK